MSLSNNTHIENPCKKWIEYSGKTGTFSYYDKETKTKIPIEKLRFVVLDELATITGFNENLKSGIYSNEVHNLSKQELNVKSFKPGISIKGLYSEIKDHVTSKGIGGRFCKNVYVLLAETSGMSLACIKMEGAALNGWIDKKCKTYENIIVVDSFEDKKKGANDYKMPVFTAVGKLKGDALESAKLVDVSLQEYFKHHENTKSAETKSDFLDAHSDESPQENNYTEGIDYEAIAKEETSEDFSVNAILTEDDGKGDLPF